MHDNVVVAFTIPRPWPQRTAFSATGTAGDGVRWRVRHNHQHTPHCLRDDPPHPDGPFPWWRPGSYSKFWRLAGTDLYWPPLVTVWHAEPGGHDALSVCSRRYRDKAGRWRYTKGWRWHVFHLAWGELTVTVTGPGGTVPHRVRYPALARGWKIQVHPAQGLRRRLLTRCAWCGGRDREGDRVNFSGSWDGPRGRWWQGEPGLYHHDCLDAEIAFRACTCRPPGPVTEHDGYGRCALCGKYRGYGRTEEELDRLRALAAACPPGTRPLPGSA